MAKIELDFSTQLLLLHHNSCVKSSSVTGVNAIPLSQGCEGRSIDIILTPIMTASSVIQFHHRPLPNTHMLRSNLKHNGAFPPGLKFEY